MADDTFKGHPSPFLTGDGEMARLTREFNWASTSIGAVDSWPQSLRTAVNIVLTSRFPMFIWWGNDLIQFYNDAYRPSFGLTGKHPEALGQKGADCWPEIWPVIYPLIRQVLDGGPSTWSENQLIPIYRNGRLEDVYWTFSYSALRDDSGDINGVMVVCNENTKKVIGDQLLRENEEQLSFAIDAGELGTWDLDPHTNKFTANARLKSWFGLAPQDEIELDLAIAAMSEEDQGRVAKAIEWALDFQSGGFYDIIYGISNKVTGERRVVRGKGRAWFNELQEPYRFNGILLDITKQEAARLQLARAEERARLAIESADLGTYEVNLATNELITSPRFDSIWDSPAGTPRPVLADMIHPEDLPIRNQAHAMATSNGYIDYEARIIIRDGSIRWTKVKGNFLYDSLGKAVKLIGITQDITEQKQFSENLAMLVKERTLELQRSNDDLLQFAHVITHDLKEPVRKVKIFTNRIKDEMAPQLPEKAMQYIGKIQDATSRMYSMIDGVLNYSQLNTPDDPPGPVDLNSLLKEVETDLEILIEQKGATLRIMGLPVVHGSHILLYQLFYNLVNNSLKFSQVGVPPVIQVACLPVNADIHTITISDNGIGFEPEHAEKIFNTFTRLNSKDSFEGTGLGLALSKKIVERHKGSISANGAAGKGAVFTIGLPVLH